MDDAELLAPTFLLGGSGSGAVLLLLVLAAASPDARFVPRTAEAESSARFPEIAEPGSSAVTLSNQLP